MNTNVVTSTIRTAEMAMEYLTNISFSVDESQTLSVKTGGT